MLSTHGEAHARGAPTHRSTHPTHKPERAGARTAPCLSFPPLHVRDDPSWEAAGLARSPAAHPPAPSPGSPPSSSSGTPHVPCGEGESAEQPPTETSA